MARSLEFLGTVENLLDRIYRIICFFSLVAMVSVSSLEIFCRFVLNHSFVWAPGMVILCSNWLIFLGMGVYMHRRQDMEVSYFYRRFFSPLAQRVTDLAVDAFLAFVLIILSKNTIQLTLMERYQSSLISLPIMTYWYTLPLFLGCILALLSRIEGVISQIVKQKVQKERHFWA
jgi:TRAP-type C4-dicarboxylate transport system permease small subunit